MTPCFVASCLFLLPVATLAQYASLRAEDIMARVAANQDRSESARARYLYVQHARVISRRGKTIQCEEMTDTRVTPGATGSEQLLLKLEGRRLVKKQYVTYRELRKPDEHDGGHKIEVEDGTADQDLVENMRKILRMRSQRTD